MRPKYSISSAYIVLFACFVEGQTKVPSNIVILSKGDVRFMHADGPLLPASFGTELSNSDIIHLGEGASIRIVCADLSLAPELAQRNGLVPCREEAKPILYRQGIAYAPVRSSPPAAGFPIVLRPRATRSRNPYPIIVWSAVANATAYRVSIAGSSWSTIVRGGTHVQYPLNAPPLVPGVAYRAIVEVAEPAGLAGLSSEAEEQADLGFTILDKDQIKMIHEAEDRIKAIAVDDPTKKFLTAILYSGNKLRFEAIDSLEALWSTMPEFAIARNLADLYRTAGLDASARRWYSQALEHALTDEARGQAAEGLARSYGSDRSKAVPAAKQALTYFQRAGDMDAAKRVDDLLKVINH